MTLSTSGRSCVLNIKNFKIIRRRLHENFPTKYNAMSCVLNGRAGFIGCLSVTTTCFLPKIVLTFFG
jgi:hypothetical protein